MGQDIQDKLVVTEFNEPLTDLYTKIEVDSYTLEKEINNKENKDFIQNSSAILDNLLKSNPTSYKGTYKIGSFKITINKLVDSNTLHLDNKQYLFNTDKFIFD
jgi:hypothetical protein